MMASNIVPHNPVHIEVVENAQTYLGVRLVSESISVIRLATGTIRGDLPSSGIRPWGDTSVGPLGGCTRRPEDGLTRMNDTASSPHISSTQKFVHEKFGSLGSIQRCGTTALSFAIVVSLNGSELFAIASNLPGIDNPFPVKVMDLVGSSIGASG